MNDAETEVLALVESGAFLGGGPLDAAVLATGLEIEIVEDTRTALEYLGGQTYRGNELVLETNWLDVRENAQVDRFAESEKLGLARDARKMERSMQLALEPWLGRLPEPYRLQRDDYTLDLSEYAIARTQGLETVFTRIFPIYRAGSLPCGWRGRYPVGKLLVHVPSRAR